MSCSSLVGGFALEIIADCAYAQSAVLGNSRIKLAQENIAAQLINFPAILTVQGFRDTCRADSQVFLAHCNLVIEVDALIRGQIR